MFQMLIPSATRKQTHRLTTNFDAAILPRRVWVSGKAPGSVTSVWVPTIVIIQAFVGVPNTKQAMSQHYCISYMRVKGKAWNSKCQGILKEVPKKRPISPFSCWILQIIEQWRDSSSWHVTEALIIVMVQGLHLWTWWAQGNEEDNRLHDYRCSTPTYPKVPHPSRPPACRRAASGCGTIITLVPWAVWDLVYTNTGMIKDVLTSPH